MIYGPKLKATQPNLKRPLSLTKAVVTITRLENHAHIAFFDVDDEVGRGGMFHREPSADTWLKRFLRALSSACDLP
jgi:hypothetical protein